MLCRKDVVKKCFGQQAVYRSLIQNDKNYIPFPLTLNINGSKLKNKECAAMPGRFSGRLHHINGGNKTKFVLGMKCSRQLLKRGYLIS